MKKLDHSCMASSVERCTLGRTLYVDVEIGFLISTWSKDVNSSDHILEQGIAWQAVSTTILASTLPFRVATLLQPVVVHHPIRSPVIRSGRSNDRLQELSGVIITLHHSSKWNVDTLGEDPCLSYLRHLSVSLTIIICFRYSSMTRKKSV